MSRVLNRITKEYKIKAHTPDYPTEQWIINPDLSNVVGVDIKYWVIEGDAVREMTDAEKDAAYLEEFRTAKMAEIDGKTNELISEGFTYDNKVFSMSAEAQINWTNLFMIRTTLSYPFEVSTLDGGCYDFQNSDALAIFYSTGLSFKKGIMDSGRELRKDCLEVTTIADLNLIVDER